MSGWKPHTIDQLYELNEFRLPFWVEGDDIPPVQYEITHKSEDTWFSHDFEIADHNRYRWDFKRFIDE